MNIDLKLKTYEQLQDEIVTLHTNNYLNDLKIKQLQSNWNSLREIIKDLGIDYLLDKMNELEGKDKE